MIQLIHQDRHHYTVYDSGKSLGYIDVSQNPYHNQHFYLRLELTRYDPSIAAELFHMLRMELAHPLQVMLHASQPMHDFLIAGGFQRKRRCYELEVYPDDLAAPLYDAVPLTRFSQYTAQYDICCKMLYDYYRETHRAVSPLTVNEETFRADLPRTGFCYMEDGEIIHFAFTQLDDESYEIAYVGTIKPSAFHPFAQSLMTALFRERDCVITECDDVDPAAMALKSLFQPGEEVPYDTYILD